MEEEDEVENKVVDTSNSWAAKLFVKAFDNGRVRSATSLSEVRQEEEIKGRQDKGRMRQICREYVEEKKLKKRWKKKSKKRSRNQRKSTSTHTL